MIAEEDAEGRAIWETLETVVNGRPATVLACKRWGGIIVGRQLIMLDRYPLQQVQRIETSRSKERTSTDSRDLQVDVD